MASCFKHADDCVHVAVTRARNGGSQRSRAYERRASSKAWLVGWLSLLGDWETFIFPLGGDLFRLHGAFGWFSYTTSRDTIHF